MATTDGVDLPRRLRVELLGVATLVGVGLAVGTAVVAVEPRRWAVGAAAATVVLFVAVRAGLPRNHSPSGGEIRPTIGSANAVTLLRGGAICAVAGFVLAEPAIAWLPAALYAVAVGLDAVDGAIARRTERTVLGARLDGGVDAYGVAVGGAAAVALGGVPAWYLLAGAAWPIYAGALWIRRRRGRPLYELPPSRLRGPIGAAQMLVIVAALAPGVDGRPVAVAAAIALVPLLVGFGRDWAAASGRWPVHGPRRE